jgi:opacity protein-like surface antigen
MKKIILALAIISTSLYSNQKAGFYVGAKVFHADTEIEDSGNISNAINSGNLAVSVTSLSEDTKSPGVSLIYGYSFSENHAIELQFSYFKAYEVSGTFGITDGFNVLGVSGNGQLEVFPIMLNYIGKIPVNKKFGFTIGAGAGGVIGQLENSGFASFDGLTSFPYSNSETEVGFAYQGQVGTYFNINENLSVNAGFRFMKTENLEFEINGDTLNYDLESKIIEAGIDYKF